MKSYIELYIGHLAAEEKAADTLSQYRGQLMRFEEWLQVNHGVSLSSSSIMSVTGIMLTEFYQSLFTRNFAVSTRNGYVISIKEFFEFLTGIGVLSHNPSSVLHCVKEKETPETVQPHMYTLDQVEALLFSIAEGKPRRNCLRDTAIVALILATGLRASEICNLNGSQIDEIRSGSVCCKRKGGNWKSVEIGCFALPHLEQYLLFRGQPMPDEALFLSQKGNRLTRNALWKSLASKQLRADLPTGVHILRHTVLSAIDHDGGSALARDIGGHSSVAITNRYVHTSPEERRQAVNSTPFARILG